MVDCVKQGWHNMNFQVFPLALQRASTAANTVLITLLLLASAPAARGHEVLPSIAELKVVDGFLEFEVQASLESFVAGLDLSNVEDTREAAETKVYDALRAMEPGDLEPLFRDFWPRMAEQIVIRAGQVELKPELTNVEIPVVGNPDLVRQSVVAFRAALPGETAAVQIGWAASLGALVLRQHGVKEPYDGYHDGGTISPPIQLGGGSRASPWQAFLEYIPIGFEHILPRGLDHILFVLGLFFLAARLRLLLWQISAFTLAHTVTLALGVFGYVNLPGAIVEPIIAASIVYVAVENILTDGLNRRRCLVVFGFGLLHGLGFASVLKEFGVPEQNFVPALLGFNLGVELGQLTVVLAAFLLVGLWFRGTTWYRSVIATPASVAIGLMGAWWFVERVFS